MYNIYLIWQRISRDLCKTAHRVIVRVSRSPEQSEGEATWQSYPSVIPNVCEESLRSLPLVGTRISPEACPRISLSGNRNDKTYVMQRSQFDSHVVQKRAVSNSGFTFMPDIRIIFPCDCNRLIFGLIVYKYDFYRFPVIILKLQTLKKDLAIFFSIIINYYDRKIRHFSIHGWWDHKFPLRTLLPLQHDK